MRLPLISLPTVYHWGTLDEERRGHHYARSHEGHGLSVSLCPDAWQAIAKLGGEPLKAVCRPDAFYLDLHALDAATTAEIVRWATRKGLTTTQDAYLAWHYDDETEEWKAMCFPTRERAIAEVAFNAGIATEGLDPDEVLQAAAAELAASYEGAPGSLVTMQRQVVLTEAGDVRARGYGQDTEATQIAAMFWLEDVVRKTMPEIVGVWWQDDFAPESYLAPSGAILPCCLPHMAVHDARNVPDDGELLFQMPAARLIDAADLRSSYTFVTDCVHSDAERIGSMIDDLAQQSLSFDEFLAAADGVKAGRKLLDRTFPVYHNSGMDIAEDWHVRYAASAYDGLPCIYVIHSAIEYVFQRRGLLAALEIHPVQSAPGHEGEAEDGDMDEPGMLRRP